MTYVDWNSARLVDAFNAAPPTDPRHRAILREQHLADQRNRQEIRLRTQRTHAGMPFESARRLMSRSERLQAKITRDPVGNNPVISDPRIADAVQRASYYYSRRAWALIDDFARSRIPPSRALVVWVSASGTPPSDQPPSPAWEPGEPPVPEERGVFILVADLRAKVARYRRIGAHGTFDVEIASNWEALELEALAAVEAAGGAYWAEDHYPCPPALAARARFES
ncbi:MAG TPA: hypothetical protein PKD09_10485 [Aggregatilinea sp.]|uniref:hypothetical protein n=1 Tax=Aggregatilinea sp. TaxID=2806333 RepID=UPI002C228AF9|nr:hypothetical protein [Aggregatilinea sp.]HML22069.1 hypothetical protein [Aggregatilinea sp.]